MFNKKSKEFLTPNYTKESNNKRLSNVLLMFSIVFCPTFAYLFNYIEAPNIYTYCLLSGSFFLPLFVFLNKYINRLKGKLSWMYFIYFIGITQVVLYDLFSNKLDEHSVIYFLCLFCLFNFSLQKFNFSLIYFLTTLISFLYYLVNIIEENLISYNIYLLVLFISSGIFFLIVYKSRNKMQDSLEEHNYYLKNIVKNLGHGVILFQYSYSIFHVIDFNKMIVKYFNTNDSFELAGIIENLIEETELDNIEILNENDYFTKYIKYNKDRTFELKINKVIFNKGLYYILYVEDISIKEKEKNIIEENRKKYKDLYIRNKSGLFTIDENGKIIDCNPAFLEIFRINSFNEFVLFTKNIWKEIKVKLLEKGELFNYKYTYQKNIDENIYTLINLYYSKETKIIEGNIVDVTELTLSSKEIEEKEKKYRLIFEESKDAIIILEEEIIVDVNQKFLEFVEHDKDYVIGKTIWDFTYNQTPDKNEKLNLYLNELKKIKIVKFNWDFSKNKTFIETNVTIAPIKIGNEFFSQCVIHDETERNKYLNELKESKESFESIIENTPEGFIIVKDKKIVFANREFYNIFNLNKEKNININKDIFGINYDKIEKILTQNLEKNNQKQLQFLIDNKIVDIELTIVSITFEKEKAHLMIFKDISYQNKLSKEQLRAELAEETNKRLSEEIEERKLVERKLEMEFLRTKAIFDSSENTFLMTLTPDLIISNFNIHSKNFFDFHTKKSLQINENFEQFFNEIISEVKLRYFRFILSSIKKGKSYQLQLKFINKNMQRKWLEVYLNPIINLNGVVSEISFVAHDITEKKNNEREILKSLKEKEVLLKEVHHRVKNNLQIISSILNLQSTYTNDKKTLEIIDESRHRIRTMAIIHENLYQNTNFSSINFKNYSRELLRNLISSYHFNHKFPVKVVEDVDYVELNLDQAIPCGLIINELVTNSLKYAFTDKKINSEIYLELKEKKGKIHLNIGDNGKGLAKNFSIENTETLGLQLVMTLVEQLDGNIRLEKLNGIKYFITFEKLNL